MMHRRTFLAGSAVSILPAAAVASSPVLTLEQRIEAAIAEIEAAMRDMHPGWDIQAESRIVRADGEAFRHGVLIFGTANQYGHEKGRWFVDYV